MSGEWKKLIKNKHESGDNKQDRSLVFGLWSVMEFRNEGNRDDFKGSVQLSGVYSIKCVNLKFNKLDI